MESRKAQLIQSLVKLYRTDSLLYLKKSKNQTETNKQNKKTPNRNIYEEMICQVTITGDYKPP